MFFFPKIFIIFALVQYGNLLHSYFWLLSVGNMLIYNNDVYQSH